MAAASYDIKLDQVPETDSVTPIKYKKTRTMTGSVAPESENDEKEEKKDEEVPMVGVRELFRFASTVDKLLMMFGALNSALIGAAMPLMVVVFGSMTDMFIYDEQFVQFAQELFTELEPYLNQTNLTGESVMEFIEENPMSFKALLASLNMTDAIEYWEEHLRDDLLDEMAKFSVYYCFIGVGVLVCGYFAGVCWISSSTRQAHTIRNELFRSVLKQEIGWFDTHEAGELTNRLAEDVNKIQAGIGDKLGIMFQWITCFFAGLAIGFVFGWELTLVMLAVSPIMGIAGAVMSKLGASMTSKELLAYAKAGAVADEVLSSIRTVTAFSGQKKECIRYGSHLTDAKKFGVKKGTVNGGGMGVVWLVMFCAYALAFWVGSQMLFDGKYTAGDILVVLFAVTIGVFALGNAAPNIEIFSAARGAAHNVYAIIDQVPLIDSSSPDGKRPNELKGNIKFKDVFFTYPSRPEAPVLNGINLDVEVGHTVALVGASGCGKSTTVQLLERFYDPSEGQIYLDGTDIRELNVKWLREHIGVVSQEPVLFDTTIEENIRYGKDGCTDEEIIEAAKKANAHNFIMDLPKKYKTLVGERGAQLSGGQKQRIAIARAMIRDPKILLLDEATSALDTESEKMVQDALDKAREGRTTIVIAHRLSTVRNADIICGFDNGKIVEKGSHDELMKIDGIYHQLVTNQTHDDDEEDDYEMIDEKKHALGRQFSARSDDSSEKVKAIHSPQKVDLQKSLSVVSNEGVEENDDDEDVPDPPMGRVAKLNASEWPYILVGCIAAVIAGLIQPFFAIIFAELLGVYSSLDLDWKKNEVNKYTVLFVLLGVLAAVSMCTKGYMFAVSGEILTMRLRGMSFKALLRQDVAFYDDAKNSTGALTTRLSSEASAVQGATGARAGAIVQALSSIVGGLVIGFIFSWQLAIILCLFAPLFLLGGYMEMKMWTGSANENKASYEEAGKIATEAITNIRTVAQLSKEPKYYTDYEELLEVPYKKNLKRAHVQGFSFSFSQSVIYFAYAACFYTGAYLISEGKLDYIDMFKVIGAIAFGAMAVGQASSFAPDYGKAKSSATRIFALLDREPMIDNYCEEGAKPNDFKGYIEFKDVGFNYPTRPNVSVLQDLNITVKPGEVVALVGSSGCGKSTTVQLLERFYDPLAGSVNFDGKALPDYHIQWMRGQMGIVQQEPILFDCSISDNIAYGDNSRVVPMDEIISAAKQANIHEFISALPDGYNTNVGDKGAQLSGGQKQRVAIARALIRNPKILLLDEATSALDTESEKVVQEALDKAQEGRTSIVIAHRLSTIYNADMIVVFSNGKVSEKGTHSELLQQRGIYYKLNKVQTGNH